MPLPTRHPLSPPSFHPPPRPLLSLAPTGGPKPPFSTSLRDSIVLPLPLHLSSSAPIPSLSLSTPTVVAIRSPFRCSYSPSPIAVVQPHLHPTTGPQSSPPPCGPPTPIRCGRPVPLPFSLPSPDSPATSPYPLSALYPFPSAPQV